MQAPQEQSACTDYQTVEDDMAQIMVHEDGVARAMTEAEIAQYEIDQAQAKADAKAEADRQKLKTATLAKLGLTAEEIASLLS